MSQKRSGDLPSEPLDLEAAMTMALGASPGVSIASRANPNHNRNICVIWSLQCIGTSADFFAREYQDRLRQALINKFAIGGTTLIKEFNVYADTTKLTVPDVNFPRPVPLGGYKITVGEWSFTIHHSTSAEDVALFTFISAVAFSKTTEAPYVCIVSDDGCADYAQPKLNKGKFARHHVNVSEECIQKHSLPMPAECTSYYALPLEILKDCIKRTQKDYNMERVQLNSVRQKFDQLRTGKEFGNVCRDAQSAGVIAVIRADGKQWISLIAVEHNEVIKAVELVPHKGENEIFVLWSLRRIGPLSNFFTIEYQALLRSALTAAFGKDGVAPIITLLVYADTTKVTVPVENFPRPVPKKGSELKYSYNTLTTGEIWITKIFHCETPDEIAAHLAHHSIAPTLALWNTEAPIYTVSDDDACGSLVADALKVGGSKCPHFHFNVSEECMRKHSDDRLLPMPAECTSYYDPLKILKDCIKRTQANGNTERVPLDSVRQLFDQLGTVEEFENVARDAENAGAIAVSRADGNEWISVTPVKWGEWVPTEGNVPADVRTFLRNDRRTRKFELLRVPKEAAESDRVLSQLFADANRNRNTVVQPAQEIADERRAIAKKKAKERGGERLPIEPETAVLSAPQPIEHETWSVSVRFGPKFRCYEQLIAFRLDPNELSLHVSTSTERRGSWKCVTIQPFGSKNDAEEFSRTHFEDLDVSPKIEQAKQSSLEILKDCIKRAQTKDNAERVRLNIVRQLFERLVIGEEFTNVVRDAENAGVIDITAVEHNDGLPGSEERGDAHAPIEAWSVTVRFNPSFEFYDQLSAFRLDPDETSLHVSTKPERSQ